MVYWDPNLFETFLIYFIHCISIIVSHNKTQMMRYHYSYPNTIGQTHTRFHKTQVFLIQLIRSVMFLKKFFLPFIFCLIGISKYKKNLGICKIFSPLFSTFFRSNQILHMWIQVDESRPRWVDIAIYKYKNNFWEFDPLLK